MSIRSEFEIKLAAFAASQSPVVLVAYEGVPFNKPPSGLWIQCFLVSSNTINPTVDANRGRTTGIYQVNCWGRDGRGSKETDDLASKVVALFPVYPKYGTVSIEQIPNSAAAYTDTDYRVVPVRIRYRTEY